MNSTFFQHIIVFVSFISLATGVVAQEYKFEIGGMTGITYYVGELNRSFLFKEIHPAAGMIFRYNGNFRWSVKANLLWGQISGTAEKLQNKLPDDVKPSFSRSLLDCSGQVEFNFLPYGDSYVFMNTWRYTPYVFGGIGGTMAMGKSRIFLAPHILLGIGLKYKVQNRVNLGCEFSFRKLFRDDLDVTDEKNDILDNPYGIESSIWKNKDWYSFLLLSISWDFGYRKKPCNSIK